MGRGLRLSLSVRHSAASRKLIRDQRLKRMARRALQATHQRGRLAISLAFVDDRTMRRLNRQYAGSDYTTDVLSFSAREDTRGFRAPPTAHILLGDIVISLPQAMRQARAADHALTREVDWLVVHGVLHLLGYDHATPRENERMRALERRILSYE